MSAREPADAPAPESAAANPNEPLAAIVLDDAPVIRREPRSVQGKKGEWKLWLVSIGLAVIVTPAFVLWRVSRLWKHRVDIREPTPEKTRRAMEGYSKAMKEIIEAQKNLDRDDRERADDSEP